MGRRISIVSTLRKRDETFLCDPANWLATTVLRQQSENMYARRRDVGRRANPVVTLRESDASRQERRDGSLKFAETEEKHKSLASSRARRRKTAMIIAVIANSRERK